MENDVFTKEKHFRELVHDWDEESKKAGKTFCHTCARFDFVRGKLATNWTAYSEMEFISSSEIREPKENKVLGKMEDWKCPKGHGISVERLFPKDEFGRAINPEVKK